MEDQGKVLPWPMHGIDAEFNFTRDRWVRLWIFGKPPSGPSAWYPIGDYQDQNWTPDDNTQKDEDLTPSGASNIYQIDGPGFIWNERSLNIFGIHIWLDCIRYVGDFRDYALVKIRNSEHQCSPYFAWHADLYAFPKDLTYLTRCTGLQKLGLGWSEVPTSP